MFVVLRNSFKDQTQITHHNIPNITSILTDHCGCRLTFDVTNLRHVVFNFHPIPKNWKLTQVQKINTGKTRVLGTFINDFGSNCFKFVEPNNWRTYNVLWKNAQSSWAPFPIGSMSYLSFSAFIVRLSRRRSNLSIHFREWIYPIALIEFLFSCVSMSRLVNNNHLCSYVQQLSIL